MITLGIDTTGKTLAVAVLRGNTPVAELLLSTGLSLIHISLRH